MKRTTPSFLLFFFFLVCVASSSRALEPNDDIFSATVLPAGVLVVNDELRGALSPDTFLGAFADENFSDLIESDDDDSDFGDGLASGLVDIPVNPDGSIYLAVTGFPDFDFEGDHSEEGEYDISLFIDLSDGTMRNLIEFSTLVPGAVDQFSFIDPDFIGGTVTVDIDNTISEDPDSSDLVDFWVFTGLRPGAEFTAETESFLDTVLGRFEVGSINGDNLSIDADAGNVDGFDSRLTGIVPESGELILAVTGFPSSGFLSFPSSFSDPHSEVGPYTLTLTTEIIPEPSSALLLLLGLATGLGRSRNQRRA